MKRATMSVAQTIKLLAVNLLATDEGLTRAQFDTLLTAVRDIVGDAADDIFIACDGVDNEFFLENDVANMFRAIIAVE